MNSGFCTIALIDVHEGRAEDEQRAGIEAQPLAFAERDDADAGEGEQRAGPGDDARSARRGSAVAKSAVRIGLMLMMKLAAPAETVSSPILSSAGVERDEAEPADAETPEVADRGQRRPGDGEEDRGGNGGDGETHRAEFQRTEGSKPGPDGREGGRPGEDRDDDRDRRDRIGPRRCQSAVMLSAMRHVLALSNVGRESAITS